MSEDNFEIGDVQFRLKDIPLAEALQGEGVILKGILPAVAAAKGDLEFDNLDPILRQLDELPKLFGIFVKNCMVKFKKSADDDGTWVSLKDVADTVFRRKAALRMAFLLRCIRMEYGDFLSETGLDLITGEVELWSSQLGSIGGSGE